MTTSAKPRLDAYVVHNDDDGNHDVFYTLATALGQTWQFQAAELVAEKHAIHLRADVHRDHGCACAVLVVPDVTGVDAATRLAAVHARREGVHRFILFIDEREPSPGRADDVERAARDLLEALGVDGNDAPAVRGPLTRCAGRTPEPMQAGMRRLLAALDDLPAFLEPAPAFTASRAFADEAALLDELRPLLAPATRFGKVAATVDETAALRGGAGGSYQGGVPYLDRDEAWPMCPRCRRPMGGILQVDARDAAHGAPPAHGLFVVFTCNDFHCGHDEVRHHPLPRADRRRREPPMGTVFCTDRPTILRPGARCWLLPADDVFAAEHPDIAARLCALTGDDDATAVFGRVAAAMGVGSLQVSAHFGGYHHTTVGTPTPRCEACDALCVLVAQLDAGDDERSLWACRDHPSASFHHVHP